MIKIESLSLIINKTPVLKDINFQIPAGEILGITGPASSGKSMLLRSLCGKIKISTGKINIKGRNINQYNKKELSKLISYLPVFPEFNPESSIFEETIKGRLYLKKILNPFSALDREETFNILDELGISTESEIRMKTLPDSLIKMALLARTINSGSDIVAFDSPEYQIDPSQRFSLIRTIKKYVIKGNKNIIIASSDIDFLIKICDRIVILKNGSVDDSGSVDIITAEMMKRVFGVNALILKNLVTGLPEIQIIDIY